MPTFDQITNTVFVIGALFVLCCILYFAARVTGVIQKYKYEAPSDYAGDYDDYDDEDEDDEDDDYYEDEDDDDTGDDYNPHAQVYGPQTFEMTDMLLRMTKPHLYADDWFETAKREYSLHAVRHAQESAKHRLECGLAA